MSKTFSCFLLFFFHVCHFQSETDNRYSELQISQTTTSHSGNYSCVTNNAVSSSTFVHIFNGEILLLILSIRAHSWLVLCNYRKLIAFICFIVSIHVSLHVMHHKGENPAELLRDYGVAMRPSPYIMLSLLLTIVTYQIFCLCAL